MSEVNCTAKTIGVLVSSDLELQLRYRLIQWRMLDYFMGRGRRSFQHAKNKNSYSLIEIITEMFFPCEVLPPSNLIRFKCVVFCKHMHGVY